MSVTWQIWSYSCQWINQFAVDDEMNCVVLSQLSKFSDFSLSNVNIFRFVQSRVTGNQISLGLWTKHLRASPSALGKSDQHYSPFYGLIDKSGKRSTD